MCQLPQISDAELQVMKIVWKRKEATSADIVAELKGNAKWKPKTVQTMITRLVNKGVIEADKTESKAFVYKPIIQEHEYLSYANENFVKKLYNGSVSLMLTSFIKEKNITSEDIEELKKILDEER